MFQKLACGYHRGKQALKGTLDSRKWHLDLSKAKPLKVLEQMITERDALPLKFPHNGEMTDRQTDKGPRDSGKKWQKAFHLLPDTLGTVQAWFWFT